jgi:polysaccharide export outer membrane protein
MMRKYLQVLIVFFVLLAVFAKASCAQTEMQQKMGAQLGRDTTQHRLETTATTHGSNLAVVPADFARLKLDSGFLLSLNVLDDPDFTGAYRIDEKGDIELPVLGLLHVAGETVSESRNQIRKKLLDGKILIDPQVELSIIEYSAPEVTILGEVSSPGKYPLLAPRKLVEVLALAGGTSVAAGNEVQISSGDSNGSSVVVHFSKATNPSTVDNVIVRPGDIVRVKRAGIVYVLGSVMQPGGYVMQEDGTLTLLQAISLAKGTALPASLGTIYLIRKNPDGTEVDISLPYSKIYHGKSVDVQLQAADVLYVSASKIKSAFINGQSILSMAASSAIYSTVIY